MQNKSGSGPYVDSTRNIKDKSFKSPCLKKSFVSSNK